MISVTCDGPIHTDDEAKIVGRYLTAYGMIQARTNKGVLTFRRSSGIKDEDEYHFCSTECFTDWTRANPKIVGATKR